MFLIHEVENILSERNGKTFLSYSLFLQEYLTLNWKEAESLFVSMFDIAVEQNCIVDLHQRDKQNQLFLDIFQPFATCYLPELPAVRRYRMKNWKWPEDGKIFAKMLLKQQNVWVLPEEKGPILYSFSEIDLRVVNDLEENGVVEQEETEKRIWSAWFKGQFEISKTELKNSNSIILKHFQPPRSQYPLVDEGKKYCILKGLAYGFETIGDRYWLILSPTNFLRSYDSISEMKLKGPIDHENRRFVSILTGLSLHKRFANFEDVKDARNYFETFNTSDSLKASYRRADGLHVEFSKPAHYFLCLSATLPVVFDTRCPKANRS